MIATFIYTKGKKDKQEETITYISSKISNYKDCLKKMSINKTQLHPLALQIKNKQDDKTTDISSKISTYEDRLEKTSIKKTQLQSLAPQAKNE